MKKLAEKRYKTFVIPDDIVEVLGINSRRTLPAPLPN